MTAVFVGLQLTVVSLLAPVQVAAITPDPDLHGGRETGGRIPLGLSGLATPDRKPSTFKTVLDMRGNDVKYQEYAGGHEMLSWRGGIAEGLKHLLENTDPN